MVYDFHSDFLMEQLIYSFVFFLVKSGKFEDVAQEREKLLGNNKYI